MEKIQNYREYCDRKGGTILLAIMLNVIVEHVAF
jgi:hypothetical protein